MSSFWQSAATKLAADHHISSLPSLWLPLFTVSEASLHRDCSFFLSWHDNQLSLSVFPAVLPSLQQQPINFVCQSVFAIAVAAFIATCVSCFVPHHALPLINLHYWSILTTGATAATFIANRVSCFVPSRCP